MLTMFALALLDQVLILNILMAGFTVEPGSEFEQKIRQELHLMLYLFTSSADCAIKNPTVFVGSLDRRGLIEIFGSPPSSGFTSIARSNSFNFTKQSLKVECSLCPFIMKPELTQKPG